MNRCSEQEVWYIVRMENTTTTTTARLSDTQIARYRATLSDHSRSITNRLLSARRLANHFDAIDQAGTADLYWATVEGLEEQR